MALTGASMQNANKYFESSRQSAVGVRSFDPSLLYEKKKYYEIALRTNSHLLIIFAMDTRSNRLLFRYVATIRLCIIKIKYAPSSCETEDASKLIFARMYEILRLLCVLRAVCVLIMKDIGRQLPLEPYIVACTRVNRGVLVSQSVRGNYKTRL